MPIIYSRRYLLDSFLLEPLMRLTKDHSEEKEILISEEELSLCIRRLHLCFVIGKKHALKKYDQFALNNSCFFGKYRIKYYTSCAISQNFCYKKNEKLYLLLLLKQKFREIAQLWSNIFCKQQKFREIRI